MNEFDPKNDLIDKYLKGELSGAALHGFEESLEQDEELRKSLEQRRLVYEVIVQYGRVEMKNYLRKQTTHRRIFSISRKNFYYAAAAIALILLGTTVVMLKLTEQATRNKENVATGLKTDKQDQNGNISNEKQPQKIAGDLDTGQNRANNPANTIAVDSGAMLIAANVKVVSIQLPEINTEELRESAVAMQRAPAMAGKYKKEARSMAEVDADKAGFYQMDSVTVSENTVNKRLQGGIKMNMNFFNSTSGEKSVLYQIGKSGEPELFIYNLPYDNPLLFSIGNDTYLKAGNEYFKIELSENKIQKVQPVNDSKLINRFNK